MRDQQVGASVTGEVQHQAVPLAAGRTSAGAARVTVLVLTYNHAGFIAKALDSVLAQDVDFAYEILIGEDCSVDGTRKIVRDYHRRHPDRTSLLLSDHNAGNGGRTLLRRLIEKVETDYWVLLDGDDYWTSPHKLAKQLRFLDEHPECALCFHQTLVIYDELAQEAHPFSVPDPKPFSTLEDLLGGTFISTPSAMFRRSARVDPARIELAKYTDSTMHVLHAREGSIGFIPDTMAAHRIHPTGWWSGFAFDPRTTTWDRRKEWASQIEFLHSITEDLDATQRRVVRQKLALSHFELSCAYAAQRQRRLALRHLLKSFSLGWEPSAIPPQRVAEGLLGQISPAAQRILRRRYDALRRR